MTKKTTITPKPTPQPPLVLIYGYRGAPLGLAALQKELTAQGFRVSIPIIPPFGEGSTLDEYTPAAYVDYLSAWLAEQHFDPQNRPVLIGHSMGSIIAAALAAARPDLVADKMVLLAPIAQKVPVPIRLLSRGAPLLPNKVISFMTTRYLLVAQSRDLPFRYVYQQSAACGAERTSKRADLAAARFSSSYCVADFDFSQDTLLVAGDKDRVTSQKKFDVLACHSHCHAKIIPGVGHLLNYENPTAVALAITNYLTQPTKRQS